jgi:transcriptional regulator with XRE-family HTH domain
MSRYKQARIAAGLIQKAAADALGMKNSHLSKIEAGKIKASPTLLNQMAILYGTTVDDLLGGIGEGLVYARPGRAVRIMQMHTDLMETTEFAHVQGEASMQAFAVRVTDDSMAPDLRAGDTVIIDPAVQPSPGRFVVARPGDGEQIVLRKWSPLHTSDPRAPGFVLRPVNTDYPEIVCSSNTASVLGVATEYHRTL